MLEPITAAGDAITAAERAEASRLAEKLKWRLLLSGADQLLDELERVNLLGGTRISERLGRHVVVLELRVGMERAARPATPATALDRVFRVEQRLFRLLQPWWWDFHHEPDQDDEDS